MRFFNAFVYAMAALVLVTACSPDDYGHDDDVPPVPEPVLPELEPAPDYVPDIYIEVEDKKNVTAKDEYLTMSLMVTKGYEVVLSADGRIKGRGNATWGYDKKPYKIKFDEKQSVLGLAANKEWVLLAEYCDKSLMRTAYMCELAQALGLPYPIHYRHVQLHMNGEYMGMYVLTDQVEKKKNRVDIEDDGFLFENDNYFWEEPLNFMTERKQYWYTFKYPDPEDGEIADGDARFKFITGFMNSFEAALYGDDFKDPDKGYRKYIDVETFAKWYLVQELIGNLEPNMYYVLPSRNARLQIAPVWDAEWSMGLAYRENEADGWSGLPAEPDWNQQIWSRWKYFGRLFEDEYFVNAVRKEWEDFQPMLPVFKAKMSAVAENISNAQVRNFSRWNTLSWHISVGLVRFDTWEEEVRYVNEFFDHRVRLMDENLK